ncbi:MAG: histidine phosphatase family protein [Bacteroidales bacterium]|jgi:phosphohistidine phosphatase|nr:histidine phosphatase family protein [Bacteroidales bacterium]
MKRNVIIVRHGKACAHDIFERDIDRVLTKRGVNDAYKVSNRILKSGIKPDVIMTSPAARASHSACIFSRAMKTGTEIIRVIKDFYPGSASKMMDEIAALDDDVKTVALFAHNPGISDLASQMTKGIVGFLPTTGTAVVSFDLDKWQDIYSSELTDHSLIIPRELK